MSLPKGIWSSERFIRKQDLLREEHLALSTMKGTLFLLTLLVTGELGCQTTEACQAYYKVTASVSFGRRALMHFILKDFNPTWQEKLAFNKIQDCYIEGGLMTGIWQSKVMGDTTFSEKCLAFHSKDD
ncbi:androgen-binding protein homolog [Acomys russatus]|uniref:androgen-binding protein homolog n=1 Tax=Acomys russatus TaxID=60746 RepID=UPI0021E26E49|nr:androgen-binding protein homolog [Acomys russatus]